MARIRTRLDERVMRDGLADSRSRAQSLIMAGVVRVDGVVVDKSGTNVADDAQVTIDAPARFVSRGGEKLEHAFVDLADRLDELGLDPAGQQCVDLGASTGGFTDCLLQRGAAHVSAIDVGHGQLHPRMRDDERVTVRERTNARHVTPDLFAVAPSVLVCDVSFISLKTLLPSPFTCMAPNWWGMVLCKPQFEAGRERLNRHGRKGVITDEGIRAEIVAEVVAAISDLGPRVDRVVQAYPPGPKGNIEYVLLLVSEDTES